MEKAVAELLSKMEILLMSASVRGNRAEVGRLLHENFVEFGSSGRIFNKQEIIELLNDEEPVNRIMKNFMAELLAPGVALVTYQVIREPDSPAPARSNRSSIWVMVQESWQMRFHQGTVVQMP